MNTLPGSPDPIYVKQHAVGRQQGEQKHVQMPLRYGNSLDVKA